jgi:hypothetical protein
MRAILGPVPVFVRQLDAEAMVASVTPASMLVLGVVFVLWVRAVRRGDHVVSALFLVAVVTAGTAAVAASRAPLGSTSPGHLLWLHVAAALLWSSLLLAVVREPLVSRVRVPRLVPAVAVGVAVLVGVWIALPDVVRPGTEAAWEYGRWVHDAVPELNGQLRDGVEPADGPMLVYGWGSVSAAFASDAAVVPLEEQGVATLSQEPDRYGEDRSYFDHEDEARGVLTVAPAGLANPPPGEVVARWQPSEAQQQEADRLVDEVAAVARSGPLVLNAVGEQQIRHRLAGYLVEGCTVSLHVSSGCTLEEVTDGPVDPEVLAELPDEAIARLYADGLVASPALDPDLALALRFDLAETLEAYLAPASS